MTGPLVPGVRRIRVPAVSRGPLLVVDACLAPAAWPSCADVVLAGVHGSPGAALAAAQRAAAELPGAVAAVAWHETTAVFARTNAGGVRPAASWSLQLGGSRIPGHRVEQPGFRAVLGRLLEVAVAGLQVGQDGQDLRGVVRRIEPADDVQCVD